MKRCEEKLKEEKIKERDSDYLLHKEVCSFVDELNPHPVHAERLQNELLGNKEIDEEQSLPKNSVLFSEGPSKTVFFSSQANKDSASKKDNEKRDEKKSTSSRNKDKKSRFNNKWYSLKEKSNVDKKKRTKKKKVLKSKKKEQKKKKHGKRQKKAIEKKEKKKKWFSARSKSDKEKKKTTFLISKEKTPKKKKTKSKLFSVSAQNDKKKQKSLISRGKNRSSQQNQAKEPQKPSEENASVELSQEQISSLKKDALKKNASVNPSQWEEIDFYELESPFTFVSIFRNKETKDRRYIVVEQELSKEEKKSFHFVIEALQTYSTSAAEIEKKGSESVMEKQIDEIIQDYDLHLSSISKKKIVYFIQKNLIGFAKINPLMKDHNIEDISCDGAGLPIFLYHREHGSIQSNILFSDEDELSGFVMRLAQKCGKHISIAHPMIDATMPDGSRIQMTLSTEVSTKGSTFTIRKFREQPFSPADLIRFNSFSAEMIAYFWLAVEKGVNGLIAGGTAAGKTSTLNALALFIPRESKIVSIEETREINLPHPNWIPGISRSGFGDIVGGKLTGEIDLYDLMKAALRQRPEYIIVGEIRGREAYVLFQAMATGHTTYSTVHADSTKSLIHRLEGEPINIPRIMLQSLDVVCLQTIARVKNKRARRCKQVIEIIDIDPTTKEILTNEVFRWDPIGDTFTYSGKSYVLEQIRNETNQSREEITAELKQRAMILEWMVKHDIHAFEEVASLTAQYYEHPQLIIDKVKGDK